MRREGNPVPFKFGGLPLTLRSGEKLRKASTAAYERNFARKQWAFHWDNEKLELAPPEDEGTKHCVGPGDPSHGFTPEEVHSAVETVLFSDDTAQLHEAATVLREVTASGEEACLDLMRQHVLQGLLRMMSATKDEALEEDAAICLLNMLAHQKMRGLIADQGVLVPLVDCLKASMLSSTKANVAAALALITRSETQTWALLTSGAIPALLQMLERARVKACTPPASSKRPFPPSPSMRSKTRGGILFSPSPSSAGDNSVHDACLALMHLARFQPIRKALLKLKAVPLLAQVAKVASLVESEQSVAALFQILARADGGPEALCIEHEGCGTESLLLLALKGEESTQELALDALTAVATSSDECRMALLASGVGEALNSTVFNDAPPIVVNKLQGLQRLLSVS